MKSKTSKNRDGNPLSMTDKLQRYAFRSTTQVIIHVLASVIVALVLYFLLHDKLSIPETHFVTITSSMSAASGALLAVTIALATFYGLHVTNWRDKLVDKLTEASARTRKQMEKSAKQYPEISRHLAPLYEESLLYVPGMPIDKTKSDDIAHSFLGWARSQAGNKKREIDAGDVTAYDSFEMHLRDAILCEHKVHHTLTLLYVARRHIQITGTFSHLAIGWVTVLILTLTFAIIGSLGIIPEEAYFSLLVIPFWLFFVGGFALVKDITAVPTFLQIQEIGFDKALEELNTNRESAENGKVAGD